MMHESSLISRRSALKCGLLSAGGLALAGPSAFANAATHKKATAKSVIQIWMWGGPSQIDTFDPKPDAGYDYCGPLKSPIATNVDGIQIGELLPMLAKQADKYSIVRSLTHGINAHETASYRTQTGREPGRLVFPGAGAVVSRFRGYDAGYVGKVPPYIVLTRSQGRFSEAGLLGPNYEPFVTLGDPNKPVFAVEGIVAEGISDERQHSRRQLLTRLDSLGKAMEKHQAFIQFDEAKEKAYAMMFGEAKELFDLSNEPDAVRDRYGRSEFGQSCLMARRLVEHGVPYITINYRGWDTHKEHFQAMNRKLPEMDRGFATLLQDLSDRGLLDSTIVWWGGEFGRGPKVQWAAPWNGGRSHHGACFSTVLAGGGFQGGQVIGKSDAVAHHVAERPVFPEDIIASIYDRLGIDPFAPLPNNRNLEIPVLPRLADGHSMLTEIM